MSGYRGPSADVVAADQGLWCHRGEPPVMRSMHRHNDIEVNVVLEGELRYLYAGRPMAVGAGRIAVFWAAQPHGLVDSQPGDVCWVHVPLPVVMRWGIPEGEMSRLLLAEPLVIDAPDLARRLAISADDWLQEVGDAQAEDIALLEIQAGLLRILRGDGRRSGTPGAEGAADAAIAPADAADDAGEAESAEDPNSARTGAGRAQGDPETGGQRGIAADRLHHVRTMTQHVMDGFREDLTVGMVAGAAHLTSSHAMTVFRRTVGVTIGEYVTMCRVAEAQRLLITTDLTTAEIASASGFGSLSSFYQHVTAACGMTPREYRRQGR